MRIIVAAMVAGCALALAVFLVISASFPARPDMWWMTVFAVGAAIAALIARAIFPLVVVAGGRKAILRYLRRTSDQEELLPAPLWWQRVREPRKTGDQAIDASEPATFETIEADAGRHLMGLLQAKTIMSLAPLEGAVFLLFIAYLLARSPISLAVGVAMIVILAAHFPTVERTSNWIEDQLRLLREQY